MHRYARSWRLADDKWRRALAKWVRLRERGHAQLLIIPPLGQSMARTICATSSPL